MAKATSDSVVVNRKFGLVLVALLCLRISVQAEADFTVSVTRRITSDIYKLNSTEQTQNCAPKDTARRTYLITEKQCASGEELFNGMYVAIKCN